MLLVGAGLLIKSFINLQHVDPGFNPRAVLRADVGLPRTRYADRAQAAAFFKQLVDRVSPVPEVEVAGAARTFPLRGEDTDRHFLIKWRPEFRLREESK